MITQQILCLHNVTDQRSLRGYTLRASSGKPEGGPFFRLGRPSEGGLILCLSSRSRLPTSPASLQLQ